MQSKLIYTALSAFGFGAMASWAITADIHEKRLVNTLEGTLEIVKDKDDYIKIQHDYINYLRDLVHESKATDSTDNSEEDLNQMTLEDESVDLSEEVLDEPVETVDETRSNLQNLIDQYTANPEDSSEEISQWIDQALVPEQAQPFVISRMDYAFDEVGQGYSKVTLTYYPRDRILLDEDEDVEDIVRTVGFRNLTQFGGVSDDADTVFIRNDRLQTDFEVVRDDDSLPLHITYGMQKEEFRVNKAAGLIKLRREDE